MEYKYKPNAGTFPEYYKPYLDAISDKPLIDILEEEGQKIYEYLSKIPEDKGNYQYAEGKWTVKEVLFHIIDTELIFTYRAVCIARGEKKSLPGFDQDEYMSHIDPAVSSLSDLTDCFYSLRKTNILLFKMMTPDALSRIGVSNHYEISAQALAYIAVAHTSYHIGVLKDRYGI